MKLEGKLAILRQQAVNFYYRVLNRLEFFPFTLFFSAFNAAFRSIQLRTGGRWVRVGEVTEATTTVPRNVMMWLGRGQAGHPDRQFDVCLRLPSEASNPNLHDAISVIMMFRGFRSIGLYWDSSSLGDDLPLLQSKRDENDLAVSARPYEDLCKPCPGQHSQDSLAVIVPPVTATRDAQTLLKRQAGGAYAVCLNLPPDLRPLADALARTYPEARFFDLSPASQTETTTNLQSLFGHGLTLHERIALVQAVDAYVGNFDELGCTALISGRPAVLLGSSREIQPERINRGNIAVWFPDSTKPDELMGRALQFLSGHMSRAGK